MSARPGCVAVGIDVGGTKIAGGIVDPTKGQVRHAVTVPTDLSRGSDAVRHATVELATSLVRTAGAEGAQVLGLGVGVPELVAPDGTITSAHLLAWHQEVLGAELAAAMPGRSPTGQGQRAAVPVRIESDVRCAARSEGRFGAGRSYPLFIYLTVGTGIAFCLVRDGQPYAGARGHAHLLLAPGAEPLEGGGQPPLLESVAGGPALVARYRATGREIGDDAREVLAAAAANDRAAMAIVRDAGLVVGDAIALLVNAFDPAAVVVGGGLGLAGGDYWTCARDRARRMIWAPQSRDLPIVDAGLGVDAGVVGAALAAVQAGTSTNRA